MTDLQRLKAQHDLRLIVEADLGPSHNRGGKALLWRCPFHHEQKGLSLAVWADGWRCFGACGEGGDMLDWLQRYRGLTFQEACEALGQDKIVGAPIQRPASAPHLPVLATPPDSLWQDSARHIVAFAEGNLWSPVGEDALAYLNGRGLSNGTIRMARLGLIPGQFWEWHTLERLSVPCGITIPWFIGDELWTVKVRRESGTPKYTQIAGGSAGGLYHADRLEGRDTVLLVEGEFDALLAEQEYGSYIGVGTLGSASSPLNARWHSTMITCRRLLVAYDNDAAGIQGAERLRAMTQRAQILQIPQGKDITEFVLQGGSIKQWLSAVLSKA